MSGPFNKHINVIGRLTYHIFRNLEIHFVGPCSYCMLCWSFAVNVKVAFRFGCKFQYIIQIFIAGAEKAVNCWVCRDIADPEISANITVMNAK